ncbi:MAG: hypothetical protein WAK55_26690 [Xanthobacteraceae bacterium]
MRDRNSTKPAPHCMKAYAEATARFQDAKANLNLTKNKVRDMLRKHSPALSQIENLEFTVAPNRKEIAVFEKLQTAVSARRGENKKLDFD